MSFYDEKNFTPSIPSRSIVHNYMNKVNALRLVTSVLRFKGVAHLVMFALNQRIIQQMHGTRVGRIIHLSRKPFIGMVTCNKLPRGKKSCTSKGPFSHPRLKTTGLC